MDGKHIGKARKKTGNISAKKKSENSISNLYDQLLNTAESSIIMNTNESQEEKLTTINHKVENLKKKKNKKQEVINQFKIVPAFFFPPGVH